MYRSKSIDFLTFFHGEGNITLPHKIAKIHKKLLNLFVAFFFFTEAILVVYMCLSPILHVGHDKQVGFYPFRKVHSGKQLKYLCVCCWR